MEPILSRVTSTPRTRSPVNTSSPSVSTIDQDVFTEVFSSESEELSGYESSSSSDRVEPKNLRWPEYWKSLKPTEKDSLYYKLMMQPKETESIAADLVHMCQTDLKKGIIHILQLCVDLCGYKKVSIREIYNFEQNNSQEIVDRLADDLMDKQLKQTGKFLFKACTKFQSKIEYIIERFVKLLIVRGFNKEISCDDDFASHIFQFLNSMAFSMFRCIRITGVVLVIKFLTAYVLLMKHVTSISEEETSFSSSSQEGTDKKTKLSNMIDFLYKIFDRNCLFPDPSVYPMKVIAAREMLQWIQSFPDVFIFKRKCLGRLIKLVEDETENVRLAAIDACAKLLSLEEIRNEMSQRVELCLKITSGRFKDASFKVTAKAINVFTVALKFYSDSITQNYILAIVKMMYFQDIKVAKSAGKFLATYLKFKHNDIEVLSLLTETAYFNKELWDLVPFFLESCIEFLPQLKDWQVIINILVGNEFGFQTRKHLLIIFKEAAMFTTTGKFTKSRLSRFDIRLDDTIRTEMSDFIMTNFEHLSLVFQKDAACMTELAKLLLLVDTEDRHHHQYATILRILKNTFVSNKDEELLGAVAKAFSHFCNNEENEDSANVLVKNVIQDLVDRFKEDIEQLSQDPDESLLIRLRVTSVKMSAMFAFFDPASYMAWAEIFDICNVTNLKVLKHTLVCCKWYLVWNLRQCIKNSLNNNSQHLQLPLKCKEFVYSCLDFLQLGEGDSVSFLIFDVISDFYAIYERTLVRKRTFSNCFIKIEDQNYKDIVVKFVVEHVIASNKINLKLRQKYLSKFVDLVYLEVIPVQEFAKILRYYHSHYVEFGEIMNHILSSLHMCPPGLPLLVHHTLVSLYQEVVSKHSVLNLLSEEAQTVKLLAKKLASFRLVKSSTNLLKLMNMIIRFGLKSEENFSFLYFGRYFAELLDDDGKKDVCTQFKKLVPAGCKRNDNILLFAQSLKVK